MNKYLAHIINCYSNCVIVSVLFIFTGLAGDTEAKTKNEYIPYFFCCDISKQFEKNLMSKRFGQHSIFGKNDPVTAANTPGSAESMPMYTNSIRDEFDKATVSIAFTQLISSIILALLVYRFTNVQARTQTLLAVHGMWQSHNFDILTNDKSLDAYRRLFSIAESTSDETIRLEYMIIAWMNIMYMQWESDKSRLIGHPFAEKSISDAIQRMSLKSDFIISLLQDRGFDNDFIKYIKMLFEAANKKQLSVAV